MYEIILAFFQIPVYNNHIKRATAHKVEALSLKLYVLTDTAYPVGRQGRHFYFRLLCLST